MKLLLPLCLTALFASCTSQTVSHPHAKCTKFPQATWNASSNSEVVSPFAPHNIIDVTGMAPGQHSYDPSTARVVNGKPDFSTAKVFQIPAYPQAD